MKEYNEQQYANQLNNLDKMDTFLERNKLPKLTKQEIENLNKLKTSKEIKSLLGKLPTKKSSGSVGFTGEFYHWKNN